MFLTATVFAFWLGFKSGKLIAWGRGGRSEQAFILGGVFLQTVFYPWFAIVMMWVFGFYLGWFPISRFIDARLWQGSPYDANDLFEQMILSTLLVTVVYVVGRVLIKRFATTVTMEARLRQALALGTVRPDPVLVPPSRPDIRGGHRHTRCAGGHLGAGDLRGDVLLTRSAMPRRWGGSS